MTSHFLSLKNAKRIYVVIILCTFVFWSAECSVASALIEEYIGENRDVVTGLSYFVRNDGSILNPYLFPSPDINTIKEHIQLTSYKTKMMYDLYTGSTQKYELAYSLYIIGEVNLEEANEIISSIVNKWRRHTNDHSTQLTTVNVEPAYGNYG